MLDFVVMISGRIAIVLGGFVAIAIGAVGVVWLYLWALNRIVLYRKVMEAMHAVIRARGDVKKAMEDMSRTIRYLRDHIERMEKEGKA